MAILAAGCRQRAGRRALGGWLGVPLADLWKGSGARRVSLPTYPFQYQRYFIERSTAASVDEKAQDALVKIPDIAGWGYRPAWRQSLPDYVSGAEKAPASAR